MAGYVRKGGWGGKRVKKTTVAVTVDGVRLSPQHRALLVAEIKTLDQGASPVDILLSIARFHMGQVGEAQRKSKLEKTNEEYAALSDDYVRTELTFARVAARDAAAYCHRRLAAVAHTDAQGNNLDVQALSLLLNKLPTADMDQLERILAFIGVATGVTAAATGGNSPNPPATSH